jgi:hypothetical protein
MAVVDGDPFGEIKKEKKDTSPEPRDVNFAHTRSDVDSSTTAQHHTLGIQHNQAAAGDHAHDGKSSRKLGTGLNLTMGGAAAGNTALNQLITMLHNVIEFNDTHTV